MLKVEEKFKCVYSNKFKRTHFLSSLKNKYLDGNLQENRIFSVCGRIIRKRVMGKASFLSLKDSSSVVQIYLSKNDFDNDYENIISYLSLGDIVGVKGKCFKTKTGEFSLRISYISVLSKNLKPFPDKWKGLLEKEICYRKRYLDLMVNSKTMDTFEVRSKLIQYVRTFFLNRNYLEVETPIIQSIPGGALARPFVTYHNYLNAKLYLRVSPELYLKRLIVGGFERVFEISKSFRNEGTSNRHNPEFTMIEFYQAYSNYKDLMILTESLFRYLCKKLNNGLILDYQGKNIDFSNSFLKLPFKDSIIKYNRNLSFDDLNDKDKLVLYMKNGGFSFSENLTLGELQFHVFEETVEKNLIDPTFIIFHPVDVSPLAKSLTDDPTATERFELYIYGREIANGFSELNDPIEQSRRFIKQIREKKNDNSVELHYDRDYIDALKYGLPPTAGEGIGIDRLVMLFTNSVNIKDVLLFPLMKFK
ncbi:MAG TPA: lysine--tRNA ligase [Candidatus Azoamicus sp. OHIO1]